ncbi:choice-of-anchor J domain-containing protein [Kaistella sp. DKR-2]|uniref:T9SS-dependent choice-of-anchor J family protein n=1 Tax=Kaistella soli TaxID=2849654 RepID=UPI001C280EF6|nr:choice-of-anchor J domain-containing protein [Kaistella soli]MBU8883903.1 choice-of-anchor J domain-containing protein [Kaistella soli]
MKKTLFSVLLALPFIASAQFSQNFDSGTTTPAGWTVLNGGGTSTFIFGPGAPGSAFSQPNAAQINYDATAHDDYLVTPAITVTAGVNDRLTYFVKNQDPLFVESYDVRIATANTAPAFATATVVTPSAPAPSTWSYKVLDLSAYVGQTVYVGFHATSADMFRLLFDDIVSDTAPVGLAVPGCATLSSPANGATGVSYTSATLTWAAPSTGGAVKYYEVYYGTTPNPTTKLNTFAPNVTSAALANLAYSTQYYWKVVAVNDAGSATACGESSFTTAVNPFAPYCSGNLVFSNGVEPLTSVQISDMTNTSSAATTTPPHESFVDKVATLEQGKTYPLTLQGYTGGSFTNRFIVFIDWNQDGDFLDAGETYFGTTALTIANSTGVDGKTAVGNIAVPADALLGNTRMRIKKNYSSTAYPNPCYSQGTLAAGLTTGYGQAEDYTIKVIAPQLAVSDNAKSQLSVYPNPVKDVLNIASADAKITSVSFYSVDGKLVKEVSKDVKNINVNDLKSGVYVVTVKASNSEKTFKVIKE